MNNYSPSFSDAELPKRRADRPITISHRVEFFCTLMLLRIFKIIGVDASSFVAGKFLRIIGPRLRSISARAEDNLRAIYPDWPKSKIKNVTADVWENLGRTTGEFIHIDKFNPFEKNARVDLLGEERLSAIAQAGKPVIFISGHFANWEIMSIIIHRAGIEYGVVYRAANNPLVDELIIKKRGAVMSRRQIPKGKRGARSLIETIKSGASLAMLIDQKLNDGIEAPFMGRPAMTAPTAARLALRFNTPVVPTSIVRLNGAHFRACIHEPVQYRPTGVADADILNFTIEINRAIEVIIHENPGQWLWLHRRWPRS